MYFQFKLRITWELKQNTCEPCNASTHVTCLEMHHSYTHTKRNNINTTPHHKQTTTHPLTNNNQPKEKNNVILQININGIRNKIEELKKLVHSTQPDIITIQETKLTQKAKTTPPYAQTESTNKEGAHHTDQGRHNFHKHKHTQVHQHTQHRTTADQNTHSLDQRHHSSKHVLSIKRHDVTTLQPRGHRHRILHTTRHQHIRLNTHR